MHRRGGTPLRAGPPSLEASNQAQINDLVQRNRTLEHTVKKLSDQLVAEDSRAKKSIDNIREEWEAKELEWREGCNILQACYSIVHLRNNVDLEEERVAVMKETEAVRKARIKILQRDFRISMFQTREAELEDRIAELEEEQEAVSTKYEEIAFRLKESREGYITKLEAKDRKIETIEKEKADIEGKLATLRAENARLEVSGGSSSSKLERVTLQLEGAQTRVADLERANDELKRANADIQRQLKKWETLEKRGDAELESSRKRHVELEIQNREIQERLDKAVNENASLLEKHKREVKEYKECLDQWKEAVEETQQTEVESTKKLNKARKQIERLKVQLETERSRTHPPSPDKKLVHSEVNASEDEVATEIGNVDYSPPPKTKSRTVKAKPKPTQVKPRKTRKDTESESEAGPSGARSSEIENPPKAPRTKKTKSKAMDDSFEERAPHLEHENRTEPSRRDKGKGKGKTINSEEVQVVDLEKPPSKSRTKRKTPPSAMNSDVEILVDQPIPGKRKPASAIRDPTTNSKRGKPSVSHPNGARPTQGEEEATDAEKDPVPKKKKRKINIFPTNNTEPLGFNFIPQGDVGLNIPTVLSPVKESEGVPARSTSGSVIGNIGSMLFNSFNRRGA